MLATELWYNHQTMKLIDRPPRVALFFPSTFTTHREVLQGIFHYVREHGPWRLHLVQGRDDEQRPALADLRSFDGVVACSRSLSPALVSALDRGRIPTVAVDATPRLKTLVATVTCDNGPIGRQAADWLVERGFRDFAFVGTPRAMEWSLRRQKAYVRRLAEHGFGCSVFDKSRRGATLASWLAKLPRPTAVFVANDVAARQVLNACADADLSVPRDVSVLSVDNDEDICETATPSLSSIQMTTEPAGYEAARLLDAHLLGRNRPRRAPAKVVYTFAYVAERQSAALMRGSDKFVERALNFIHLNYAHDFRIDDLAEALGLSRRMLEIKYKRVTGRSPHAELLRYRLDRARTLIVSTSKPLDDIASECGFTSACHLAHRFREHFGQTPSSLRR